MLPVTGYALFKINFLRTFLKKRLIIVDIFSSVVTLSLLGIFPSIFCGMPVLSCRRAQLQ